MLSSHLILYHSLLLLPSVFPSIRVISSELTLGVTCPKYGSFSFSINPCNEYSGLVSFMIDWFHLLAVQGTLKSLLSTTIWKQKFLNAQPSLQSNTHIQTTTVKTVALSIQTFVGKEISLLFNTLCRFVITLFPRSKCLLISWLLSPSATILNHRKENLSDIPLSPSIFLEVMGLDAMILIFWILNFKPAFSLSSFTHIMRLFTSSSLSAIRVVSSAYLKWLLFLPAILITACYYSSLAFCMMHSAYNLNK